MLSVENIGIGTYKLLGNSCTHIVRKAIENGYRVIDTAELYNNHLAIRDGIILSQIDRDKLYISSKIHDKTQKQQKNNKNTIRDAVIKILDELGTNYLDQLLLHSAVKNRYVDSWLILEELVKEGLVRNIGVSNFRIDELENILQICSIKPCVNQFELSPFCTRERLVKMCKQNNILVQAYGSLTVGRRLDDVNILNLAHMLRITPAHLLLFWALKKGFCIIPKADTEEQLIENLNVGVTFAQINDNEQIDYVMGELDKLNESYYTIKKHIDKIN
jgi:diketogulonate reductase-like aldo/keto reductase